MSAIHLLVEEEFHRAMPGGTGGVKTITNYAPVRRYLHPPFLQANL
jgi:branched-chain amino acid aminotransferase